MKISKDHFVHQENALTEKIGDIAACFLNDKNYGLLPLGCGISSSFDISFFIDNFNVLKVTVTQCRAITQGGTRIEILESQPRPVFQIDLAKEFLSSKPEEEKDYYVILSVDPFNREPFGDLIAEEEPPRYPFSIPAYKINLIQRKQIAKSGIQPNSLIVGKINFNQNKPEIDEDYIPACIAVTSHNKLVAFHSLTEKFFSNLELNILSIIKKIREKGQDSSLALSVLALSENLLNFTSGNYLQLRWKLIDQPPVYLFEFIATTARIIRNAIESNTSANKEELLNYFTSWSELKQGDLEKLLTYCINFDYQHHETLISLEQFEEFMQIIDKLFEKLESLAYVGKKKETNIFVKEDKPKRSFLLE